MLSPHTIRKLKKIVPFTIIWLIAGVLYALVERGLMGNAVIYPATGNDYDFKTSLIGLSIGSPIMGFLVGVLEVTLFKNIFKQYSFRLKLLLKTLFYVLVIFTLLVVLTFLINGFRLNLPIWNKEVVNSMYAFVGNFAFTSTMIYGGVFVALGLFVSEMIDSLGVLVISSFFTGRYYRPQVENRIFMFLDMKSSTTIAEKLGHETYYQFLNAYYRDMTKAIIETQGEIYQYVGDEIVVSWPLAQGLNKNNCLRCFFLIKAILVQNSSKYLNTYGLIPEFKAGLHCGQVTTGEIGVIKKDILFTGDILNTTARIQALCNTLQTDLLLSHELVSQLKTDKEFSIDDLGEFELRGKGQKVKLYTVKLPSSRLAK